MHARGNIMTDNKNVEKLIDQLKSERKANYKNGIYHYTQTTLAYNSNRIEGSKLSHEHTVNLFNTHTILSNGDEIIDSNDIIETMNHFRAFDFILTNYDQNIDEDFVKEIHRILKSNTTDADIDWFNVGEYKSLSNTIGDTETCPPENVASEMQKLIEKYTSLSKHDFHTLLSFHVHLEEIHPFQDGNGRVGRLLLFKDCLKYGIIPFIIDHEHKLFYYRGLREFHKEPGYLTDTCLSAQDKYTAYCRHLVNGFSTDNPR